MKKDNRKKEYGDKEKEKKQKKWKQRQTDSIEMFFLSMLLSHATADTQIPPQSRLFKEEDTREEESLSASSSKKHSSAGWHDPACLNFRSSVYVFPAHGLNTAMLNLATCERPWGSWIDPGTENWNPVLFQDFIGIHAASNVHFFNLKFNLSAQRKCKSAHSRYACCIWCVPSVHFIIVFSCSRRRNLKKKGCTSDVMREDRDQT